jgi:hypothetical protein
MLHDFLCYQTPIYECLGNKAGVADKLLSHVGVPEAFICLSIDLGDCQRVSYQCFKIGLLLEELNQTLVSSNADLRTKKVQFKQLRKLLRVIQIFIV